MCSGATPVYAGGRDSSRGRLGLDISLKDRGAAP